MYIQSKNNDIQRDTRILLVDDEPDLLEIMGEVLTDSGAVVKMAKNGLEALELMGSQTFDVVVSDVTMPKMDGIRLCHEIVNLPPHKTSLPKVFLVTGSDRIVIPDALKTKLHIELIMKPFDIFAFTQKIFEQLQP